MDIGGFLKAKAKPLSANTLRNYENSLDLLARMITGAEPVASEIEDFLNHYDKSSTLQRHKSAIQRYWEWRFPGQPLEFGKDAFFSAKKKIPKLTEPYVVQMMLDRITDPDDKMFLRSLFVMGCRIRELMSIKLTAIIDTGVIMVVKGGNEQIKVCPSDFLQELRVYAGAGQGLIFEKSYDYYYTLIKRLGEAVGHPEMSPHMVRHARGIDLIDKGADPAYVAQYLGHKNTNTVWIYLAVSKRGLQSRIEKFDEQGNK